MATPIWKDTEIDLGTAEYSDFVISSGGAGEIYRGRAYRRPGEARVRARINDVCADYLTAGLPVMAHLSTTLSYAARSFTYSILATGRIGILDFVKDYSYDYGRDYSAQTLSSPAVGRADARQWIMATRLGTGAVTFTLRFKSGGTSTVRAASVTGSGGAATGVIDLTRYPGVESVSCGTAEYAVAGDCFRHVLYYVNAHGGWDSLLIEGASSEADELERFTAGRRSDNSSPESRGTENYLNSVEKTHALRTGWLSDGESSRMHEVLNSTGVYLFDLGTRLMRPVVLIGTTTEYKTYKGNGNRLVNYTINARIAQQMERR